MYPPTVSPPGFKGVFKLKLSRVRGGSPCYGVKINAFCIPTLWFNRTGMKYITISREAVSRFLLINWRVIKGRNLFLEFENVLKERERRNAILVIKYSGTDDRIVKNLRGK